MLTVKKTETILVPQTTTVETEIETKGELAQWVISLGVDEFNADYITRILIGYNPEIARIDIAMALDRLRDFIKSAEKVIESQALTSPGD